MSSNDTSPSTSLLGLIEFYTQIINTMKKRILQFMQFMVEKIYTPVLDYMHKREYDVTHNKLYARIYANRRRIYNRIAKTEKELGIDAQTIFGYGYAGFDSVMIKASKRLGIWVDYNNTLEHLDVVVECACEMRPNYSEKQLRQAILYILTEQV